MKTNILSLSFLSLCVASQAEDYVPIIVQTTEFSHENATPSTKFLSNTDDLIGTTSADSDVHEDTFTSARFDLYSALTTDISDSNNVENDAIFTYHDTAVMGVFIPEAKITVVAPDTDAASNPATRADIPIDVYIEVDGLKVGDPDAQDSMKSVEVQHSYTYIGDETSTTTDGSEVTIIDDNTNYAYKINYINQIPATDNRDSDYVYGQETISVYALADHGFDTSSSLDSTTITIFPKTSGELLGYDEDAVYQVLPELQYTLDATYPGNSNSECYSRVILYSGERKESINDYSADNESYLQITNRDQFSDKYPKQVAIPVIVTASKMNEIFADLPSETYTIELIQKSIHGIDRLGQVTFDYVPTVTINANNITTSE